MWLALRSGALRETCEISGSGAELNLNQVLNLAVSGHSKTAGSFSGPASNLRPEFTSTCRRCDLAHLLLDATASLSLGLMAAGRVWFIKPAVSPRLSVFTRSETLTEGVTRHLLSHRCRGKRKTPRSLLTGGRRCRAIQVLLFA